MTDDEAKKSYALCLGLVKRLIRVPDPENLAADIWLESYVKTGAPPSIGFVRYRCIDHLRTLRREARRLEEFKKIPEPPGLKDTSMVNEVLDAAQLTRLELDLIYQRFFAGKSSAQIAAALGLSENKVKESFVELMSKLRRTRDILFNREEQDAESY